jgi:IS605 OrfB family transposase
LAVTPTNHHGNLLKSKSFIMDLPLQDKSSDARIDTLSCALDKVVNYALMHKLPIAAEELDFSAKKSNMTRKSKKHRVMLSSLMYSKYQELLASKCARAGVELIKVNPAYTSVIGRIKYTLPYGQSVHLAASGVIARRAQGYREKVPSVAFVATGPIKSELVLPVRNRTLHTSNRWHYFSQALRKTLYNVISKQKQRDKHRFRYRQQSLG